MITHFICMVHWFVSSTKPTTSTSTASCKATRAVAWKCKLSHCSCVIYLTHHAKGNFLIRKSVVLWKLLITWRATNPGLNHFFISLLWAHHWLWASHPPSSFSLFPVYFLSDFLAPSKSFLFSSLLCISLPSLSSFTLTIAILSITAQYVF